MEVMTLAYWKGSQYWLGQLVERPDIVTQGRTLAELQANALEALALMIAGASRKIRRPGAFPMKSRCAG